MKHDYDDDDEDFDNDDDEVLKHRSLELLVVLMMLYYIYDLNYFILWRCPIIICLSFFNRMSQPFPSLYLSGAP